MFNYHTDLVWQINKLLLAVSLIISLAVILYTSVQDFLKRMRNRQLALLKKRLEDISGSAKDMPVERCELLISKLKAMEIINILREEKPSLPEEFEQELRACFISEGKTVDANIKKNAANRKNKWRRILAIISLGYSKDPSVLPILKDGLLDNDADVSHFSMLALGQIKSSPAADILLDYLTGHIYSGQEVASLLETFPSTISEKVAKLTDSPDPKVRFWAVKILSKLAPLQHIEKIMELPKDNSADVRAASCECLGSTGSPETKNALMGCLGDEKWFVRMHAVRALYKTLDTDAIPEVISLIRDKSWLVRDSVKKILEADIDASLPHIEKSMQAGDDAVKADCIEVLEDSGYLETLLENIFSQDETVRQKSRLFLVKNVIHRRAHLGLESIIKALSDERQKEILRIIADVDKVLAEHIEAKIKGRIVET